MTYNLFLDDERDPPNDGREWVVVRSVVDAVNHVNGNGFPTYVSFDNDLGYRVPEGRDFARWLVQLDINTEAMPADFSYYVHSQNPVARDAIVGLLDGYLRNKRSA